LPLSLQKTKVVAEISSLLYNFLPGQAHPFADQSISFQGIASELGLGHFWPCGSKLPAITSLLEKTLENKSNLFCSLILEIVRGGIKYRNSKSDPITREEIQKLNNLILNVEFKIPELWDSSFLETLASNKTKIIENEDKQKSNAIEIAKLCKDFLILEKLPPQERGFAFERFLKEFFKAFDLNPRASFRNQGEQIDGSLEFENLTYLIEAKWQNKPVGIDDLLVFHSKVEGKATWSRGIFISMSGFTEDGLTAFSHGRPTNIIAFNGQDIYFILEGKMRLDDAIRLKARKAAETGEIMVSVYDLALHV
jgi:hypothetical protein